MSTGTAPAAAARQAAASTPSAAWSVNAMNIFPPERPSAPPVAPPAALPFALLHRLRIGDEVDYNCVHKYWTPARVEGVSEDGAGLQLRFSIGTVDMTHAVQLGADSDRARIAPVGMRSCPVVPGLALDVLARSDAVPGYITGHVEQWQRGEVLAGSHGGVQPVQLRVASSGDKVLGITYGPKAVRPAGVDLNCVTVDAPLLAPGGCFAKWVPTAADVLPRTITEPCIHDLARRSRAFFGETAAMTARLHLGGRLGLLDYDVVDVLPRTRRRKARYGQTSEETLVMALAHARLAGDLRSQSIHGRQTSSLDAESGSPGAHASSSVVVEGGRASGMQQAAALRHPDLWYMGRIKWEAPPPPSPSAKAPAAAGGKAPPASAKAVTVPWVYWFEPCIARDGYVTQVLRRSLLTTVTQVAPVGTFSLSFVPGMRLETRRLGGCWGFCDVVSADRAILRVRVHRLPRELDRAAERPKEVAAFGKGAGKPRSTIPSLVAAPTGVDSPRRRASTVGDAHIAAVLAGTSTARPESPFKHLQESAGEAKRLLSNRVSKRYAQLEALLVSSGLPGSPTVQSESPSGTGTPPMSPLAIPSSPAAEGRAARVARLIASTASTASRVDADEHASRDSHTNGTSHVSTSDVLEGIPEDVTGVADWDESPHKVAPAPLHGMRPLSSSFGTALDFGVKRGRTGAAGEHADKDVETIPHHLWMYLVARSGHYCAPEEVASGPAVDKVRRGSVLFVGGAANPVAPRGAGAVAIAAAETVQVANMRSTALPEAARDRLGRRKSVFDGFLGAS